MTIGLSHVLPYSDTFILLIITSLFLTRYDRPKTIYVYEIKNWLMIYNSYLNQFIELLSYFEYEDF